MARSEYEGLARVAAKKYGLDPDIFVNMIQQESGFDPNAVSPRGAAGLGQLLQSTADSMGVDPFDPAQNLDGAARYLKKQLDTNEGDYSLALAAYNAGPAAVARYEGIPPYKETQDYVKKILGDSTAAVDTMVIHAPKAGKHEDHGAGTPEDKIFQGLREDYPELAEFDDDVLFDTVRQYEKENGLDLNDQEFRDSLTKAYAPEAYAPQPSLKDKALGFGKALAAGAKDAVMAPFDAAGTMAGAQAMEKPLAEMDSVDYQDLLDRGYSAKIARHVMEQRAKTQQELAGTLQETAAAGQAQATEGAASYISTAAGLGLDAAVLSKLSSKGLQWLAKRGIEGAAGFGGYEAIKAAGEEKPAGAIFDAALHGAKVGLAMGPGLGLAGDRILKPIAGKAIQMMGAVPRYLEKASAQKAAALRAALATQADDFATKFNGDWMRTRFGDMLAQATAAGGPLDVTTLAGNIMRRVLGDDVLQNTSEGSLAKIGAKIKQQQLLVGLDPNLEPHKLSIVPPVESPPRLVLDKLIQETQGGLAPEPARLGGYSPAVPSPNPATPTAIPAAPVGMEGVPVPVAAPTEPIVPETRPGLPGGVPPSDDLQARPRSIGLHGGMAPEPGVVGSFNPAEPAQTPLAPNAAAVPGLESALTSGDPSPAESGLLAQARDRKLALTSQQAPLVLDQRPIFPGSVTPEELMPQSQEVEGGVAPEPGVVGNSSPAGPSPLAQARSRKQARLRQPAFKSPKKKVAAKEAA